MPVYIQHIHCIYWHTLYILAYNIYAVYTGIYYIFSLMCLTQYIPVTQYIPACDRTLLCVWHMTMIMHAHALHDYRHMARIPVYMYTSTYSVYTVYGGEATMSRLLKIISLFCRIESLEQGSIAKETYDFKEPISRSHPIPVYTVHDYVICHTHERVDILHTTVYIVLDYDYLHMSRIVHQYI